MNKVYAVISELYNQEPYHLVFFDSLDKAKKYLYEMSKTFQEDCVCWHESKELFKVKNTNINNIVDKFYIEKYEVH